MKTGRFLEYATGVNLMAAPNHARQESSEQSLNSS